jgi:hypothetical protein
MQIQTGILDKTRLVANVLMLTLVALNIFFTINYSHNIREKDRVQRENEVKTEERLKTARFMKLFIDKVLGTNGTITFEDRVKLENDIRVLGDNNITNQWELFVNSVDSESAQRNAILLMSMLMSKMI